MNKFLRPCVLIVVYDSATQLSLACERSDTVSALQFPQGGIEKGETPKEAAQRELAEETGLTNVEWGEKYYGPFDYYYKTEAYEKEGVQSKYGQSQYGQKYGQSQYGQSQYGQKCGQSQFWFLAYCNSNSPIKLNDEFQSYKWMKPKDVADNIVSFKKEVYKKGLAAFKLI